MCNWYTSSQNYDMVKGGQVGAWNIMCNNWFTPGCDFTYPVMNFNQFTPYPNFMTNTFLLDPSFTMSQMFQGGGFGWSSNGGFPSINWNMNNPFGGNWGWNGPSNPNENGGATSSGDATEDELYKRRYNTLLSFTKELVKQDGKNDHYSLTESETATLTAANKGTKGTWKEKFEALYEAYSNVSKDTIKEFMTSSDSFKIGDKPARKVLESIGFEYSDGAIDANLIGGMHDCITSISDTNTNLDGISVIVTGEILDILSSWNSAYPNERIVKKLAEKYNDSSISDQMKTTIKSQGLDKLVSKLCAKARTLKSGLDSSAQSKIEDLCTKVNDELNKSSISADALSNAFDELYVYTRKAAIATARKELTAKYGEIDAELFSSTLFEDETNDDLRKEGFSEDEITSISVTVKTSAERAKENAQLDSLPVSEQVNELVKSNVLEKTSAKYAGYDVYQEKTATNNGNKRAYIMKGDKLVELKDVVVKDGNLSWINNDHPENPEEVAVKPSSIKTAQENEAASKAAESKNEERVNEKVADYKLTDTEKKAAFEYGKEITESLRGWTSQGNWGDIFTITGWRKNGSNNTDQDWGGGEGWAYDESKSKINPKNVLTVYNYFNSDCWGDEFFEQCHDEGGPTERYCDRECKLAYVFVKNLKQFVDDHLATEKDENKIAVLKKAQDAYQSFLSDYNRAATSDTEAKIFTNKIAENLDDVTCDLVDVYSKDDSSKNVEERSWWYHLWS